MSYTHCFDVDVAKRYGVNCAVILNNIYYWITKNEANGENFYDGYYWTYNSTKAFNELFPYLTQKQIETALKKLRDEGILITGNYNENKYDRTLWYAITEKGKCILHTGEMDFTSEGNGFYLEGKAIPNINTNINTNINNNINNNNKNIDYKKENKKEKGGNFQENQIETLVPKGAYEEILNYLNEKTKRNFRNIETNRKHIRARFNESKSSPYTVEDFKRVIDNKCDEWLGDEKMQKYLRPETLFGRKFESYLNNDSKWKGYNCKRTNEIEESDPYADQQFGLVL